MRIIARQAAPEQPPCSGAVVFIGTSPGRSRNTGSIGTRAGRFYASHNYPAVVRAGMGGAVDIVDSGGPTSMCHVALAISKNKIVDLCGHDAVQRIVAD